MEVETYDSDGEQPNAARFVHDERRDEIEKGRPGRIDRV